MVTTPTLWKSQTQVNTSGADDQYNGQVLGLPDGGYLVAWADYSGVHSPGSAIVGQRYNAFGQKVGGEVELSHVNGEYDSPSLTLLSNGNVAVAYADFDDINDANLLVRIFNSDLAPLRLDIIDVSAANTVSPEITALSGERYAISYRVIDGLVDPGDIVARVVSSTGVVGGQFDVLNEADTQQFQEIATLSNGNFVVAFHDQANGDSDDNNVRYRIFSPEGTPIIGNDVVGANSVDDEKFPDVAALKNGGFVVVWNDETIDGAGTGIGATLYSNFGGQIKVNFQVNTQESGNQSGASVVALADGGFLVTWVHQLGDVVQAQRFDGSGNRVGGEFTVASGEITDKAPATLLKDGRIAFAINSDRNGDDDVFTSIFDPRDKTINGTSKDDVLTARRDGATVNGLAGNDELFGFSGKDDLRGGRGKDSLLGGANNDNLNGGDNSDLLMGGSGIDALKGGKGNDTLSGGAGMDTLTGGLGRDILSGGTSRDVFDFNAVNESPDGGNRDIIDHFQRGIDDIDLRSIDAKTGVSGNNAFTFIGTDSFNDVKGELRIKDLGTQVIVQGDVNGNGLADFEIKVNVGSLAKSDFLL